jgi:hypothetical protein
VYTTIGQGTDILTGVNDTGQIVGYALVPEPSTWAMMLLGFAGLSYAGYRTARKGASG